jgi:hypothetical protein
MQNRCFSGIAGFNAVVRALHNQHEAMLYILFNKENMHKRPSFLFENFAGNSMLHAAFNKCSKNAHLLVMSLLQVGDKIKALVVHIDCKGRRLSLSTQHLEKEPGDMLQHGMNYVCDSAEEQAAAYRERLTGEARLEF